MDRMAADVAQAGGDNRERGRRGARKRSEDPGSGDAVFRREFHCRACGDPISLATFADGEVEELRGTYLCPRCQHRRANSRQPRLREGDIIQRLEAEGFTDLRPVQAPSTALLYHGRRRLLEQPVTLKVLETAGLADRRLRRFLREAKIAAGLSHPHIVRVLDIQRTADLVYIVLERFEGRTLLEEIEAQGRLEPIRALAIALPVARALAYAHEQGVVHRDLKPANIMVGREGDLKLIDFGLAKMGGTGGRVTKPDEPLGTIAYAAPEQLRDASQAGAPADVYGLGATLYHALTGKPPRVALPELLGERPIPRPIHEVAPQLPAKVLMLVEQCMHEHPASRIPSARELAGRVEATLRSLLGFRDGLGNVDVLVRVAPPPAKAEPSGGAATGAAFYGRFAGDELMELAQLVELNTRSGVLEVETGGGAHGRVVFRDGKAITVRFRERRGEEALLLLFQAGEGRFHLRLEATDEPAEHALSLSPILLEAVRRRDERGRDATREG